MNILKPIPPLHISEAFANSKTKAHSEDVCELGMGKTHYGHSCHGPGTLPET